MSTKRKYQFNRQIDFDILKNLCKAQCTIKEIEAIMEIDEDTINECTMKGLGMTFTEFRQNHSNGGKALLRQRQIEQAKDNVKMSIWLGKQYLGQKENVNTNEIERLIEVARNMTVKVKEVATEEDDSTNEDRE